jgi:alpha-D-xyloside xylohydrolase
MFWKPGILRTGCDGWEVMPILILFLATSSMANAQMPGQKAPGPPPEQVEQTSHGLRATAGREVLDLTVCSDSVIRVVATPEPSPPPASPRPWMLDGQQSCPGGPFTFAQDAKAASIKTAQLEVIVNIERGNLSFRTIGGESLLNEGNSIARTYEPVELNGEHTYRVTDSFSPSITEAVYGLGQHQSGMFNYRGATVELGQNNTDVAIPLLISNKGYGLMWNSAALTYFDNRFPLDMKLTSIAGKSIDYYFLYGPEIDAVLHEYRTMTGHSPMLPKWAYGFFQSKDRYISLDEIRGIAERYRREHIPLDAIVQDWFWWKTEGDPVFNSNYHDVAQDLEALHKENVHAMISV